MKPPKEEQERAEALLLLLLARGWARRFVQHERELELWYRDTLRRLGSVEGRAAEAMRGGVRFAPGARGAVIELTSRDLMNLRGRLKKIYGEPLSEKGIFGRQGLRRLQASRDQARADAKAETAELQELTSLVGLEADVEAVKGASGVDPQTRFALLADIENLALSTGHKASVGASGLRGADPLALGSTRAKMATKVPRSRTANTFKGTSRRSYREGISASAGASYSGWLGYSPVTGGRIERVSTAGWARRARAGRAKDGWITGNPVAGFGMHVGSRTYFMPVPSPAILSGLAVLMLQLGVKVPEDQAEVLDPGFEVGGPTVETLRRSIERLVERVRGRARQLLRRPREYPRQTKYDGLVVAVLDVVVVFDYPFELGSIVEIHDGKGSIAQVEIAQVETWSSLGRLIWLSPGGSVKVGDLATTQLSL